MGDTERKFSKRIIVGGTPRSGSTMLRFILDTSESIIAEPETGFFLLPLSYQQLRVERISKRIADKLDISNNEISMAILSNQSFFRPLMILCSHIQSTLVQEKNIGLKKHLVTASIIIGCLLKIQKLTSFLLFEMGWMLSLQRGMTRERVKMSFGAPRKDMQT